MQSSADESTPAPELKLQTYSPGVENDCLTVLQECFGPAWGDLEYWRNKHIRRPHFDPRDVYLFTAAGEPAACFHTRIVELTLEPGLVVKIGLGGDFAVRAPFRKRGLIEEAQRHYASYFYEQGATIRAGFTSGELFARVYQKRLGDVSVPTATNTYRKALDSAVLAEKLRVYADAMRTKPSVKRILRHGALRIAVVVPGYDPCLLELTTDAATIMTMTQPVDVRVTMSYTVLAAVRRSGGGKLRALVTHVLSGRMRVKGLTILLRRLI